ncbi:MAG: selenium-dependent molybdenum cofactor biosynthesis protein YqeB [Acidobacteriia bacterium]|nr:selenium-dependent molybdenum cofactor biosynthesis protein YqeB [Terriglobia bacterium]
MSKGVKQFDGGMILIRGAGEMASGVAHKLVQCGFQVLLTEIEKPLAIRRTVAYAECVYAGRQVIESIEGIRVSSVDEARDGMRAKRVPVMVDPDLEKTQSLLRQPGTILIDARMLKGETGDHKFPGASVIALGPGFLAPRDARFVIETNRGHDLGRVIELGEAQTDTSLPAEVEGYASDRVLYAPLFGVFHPLRNIGDTVAPGESLGQINSRHVVSNLKGVVRGLLHDGVPVSDRTKVADVDPRGRPELCFRISDKARAIAGGALEAVLRIVNSL